MLALRATPFGTIRVPLLVFPSSPDRPSDESPADIARTQAIFQTIQLVSAKREAEKELEVLRRSRLRSEQQRSRPGTRGRPSSRDQSQSSPLAANLEEEQETEEDHPPSPRALSRHSYRIGYLPPEKEPPPFKGSYTKKKT
jgi:hypothetical protein